MHGLKVASIKTEDNPESSQKGAMTMHCTSGGSEILVRTAVLTDQSRNVITADAYLGKIVDVRGVVALHDGVYEIKVLSSKDITIE